MMLVLSIIHSEKGIGGRLKRKVGKVTLTRQNLGVGYFYRIDHFSKCDKIYWRKIEKRLAGKSACIVMPKGITMPQNSPITKFDGSRLREKLLLDIFTKIILSSSAASVALLDPRGELAGEAECLLPKVGQLYVITQSTSAYDELCERAVFDYGTAPIITQNPQAACDVTALYSPAGEAVPPCRGVIFGGRNGYAVEDGSLCLPEWAEKSIPPDISPLDFCAAALEEGLMKKDDIILTHLFKNGGRNSIEGISKIIK